MMRQPALLLFAVAACAVGAQPGPADRAISSDAPALTVAFLDGGKTVAAVCRDGKLRLWDARSGAIGKDSGTRSVGQSSVFVSGAGSVASLEQDGSIQLFDLRGTSAPRRLKGSNGCAGRFALSNDSSRVATSHVPDRQSGANLLQVRDFGGKPLFSATAGIGGVSVLAFSPDGSKLLAGSNDADLRVWSVSNGELVRVIDELPVTMFAAAFSPDGKRLATAGADRTIYLWDTSNWHLAGKIGALPEMISTLEFSPDGSRLAAGGFSELTVEHPVSVTVWHVATGRKVRSMPAPRRVSAIAFSPDGRQIASAYGGASLNLWTLPD